MKKNIIKIGKFELNEKWMAVLALFALVLIVYPFLKLALFAMPSFDDYGYAGMAKRSWESTNSLIEVIKGAITQVRISHDVWQGTYSSIFFMALCPVFLGFEFYKYGVLFVILFFVLSAFVFLMVSFKKVFKAETATALLSACVITGCMVEFIYTAQQGFFWYNAAVHYTVMFSMELWILTCLILFFSEKRKGGKIAYTILLSGFCYICAGANYITSLQALLLMLLAVFGAVIYYRKGKMWEWIFLLLPLLIYIWGFYENVSAPGNAIRGNAYTGLSPLMAVGESFVAAIKRFWTFTGADMFLAMLFFLPMAWNMVHRESRFRFRVPVLVTLFSFCFYATGFTSAYYAMGTDGLSRMHVVVKFTLQLLLFGNELYWLGWIAKRKKETVRMPYSVVFYVLLFFLYFLNFQATENKLGTYSSYGCYYFVHSGEAGNFKKQFYERVEMIENGGDMVALPPAVWKPWFLFPGDITEDPEYWANQGMAGWFGKRGIYIEENSN